MLSTVAADIFGKSGRAILDALVAGEPDPEVVAELALGQMYPPSLGASTNTTPNSSPWLRWDRRLCAKIDTLTARGPGGSSPAPPRRHLRHRSP